MGEAARGVPYILRPPLSSVLERMLQMVCLSKVDDLRYCKVQCGHRVRYAGGRIRPSAHGR